MYINSNNPSQINLMDELVAINKENALKKRLQENISLTYMNNFNETRKVERMKVFQQIQVYIKRGDFDKLSEFCKKNANPDENMNKEFQEEIKYKKTKSIPTSQLENSKDRLVFLNKLITTQTNGYDPVKNFMQKYRMKNTVVQQRRSRERELRLKFLKTKEVKQKQNKLMNTVDRINRAKQRQDKIDEARLRIKNRDDENKKKKTDFHTAETHEIVKEEKNSQVKRIEDIGFKDGDITENVDFLCAGMYELPKYDRAIVFKFMLNLNNLNDKVIDLIDNDGDLLLHINVRKNSMLVLNSNIDNIWGKEICLERVLEGKIEFKILVKSDYYKLLLNDQVITFFIQRKKSKINFFNINDDAKNFVFKIM